MSEHTITFMVDRNPMSLQRVATVLAHQRTPVKTMALDSEPVNLWRVRLVVEDTQARLDQLVQRLDRTVCVRRIKVALAEDVV